MGFGRRLREPDIERYEFHAEVPGEPQIACVVSAQTMQFPKLDHAFLVDIQQIDRRPSVICECAQDQFTARRVKSNLLQANTHDFEGQENRREKLAAIQSSVDFRRLRFKEDHGANGRSINNFIGHDLHGSCA